MAKLLMISGDRALAQGKQGAFYNTLEEFHKHWERIDIIVPRVVGKLSLQPFPNVYLHPSPWPLWLQSWWILKKGRELYRQQSFDSMTVHEYPPFYNGLGARWLSSAIKVSYILEIMHIPGYPKAANLKETLYCLLMKLFIAWDAQKAKAVRVINRVQVPNFLVAAGIPKAKLTYIHAFYIDLETFHPIDVEKKYDLVFAARLEKNKGIFNLIEAVRVAKKQKPDISLLIIGNGSLKSELERYIADHDLSNNIFFSGWLETSHDVARAYNSARIFINPSFNEGGPRVVLEAMACGLPVITTEVGVVLDIMQDGISGAFTSWEPTDMATVILGLLAKPQLQETYTKEGLQLVQQFERHQALKQYATALQRL